MKMMDQRK